MSEPYLGITDPLIHKLEMEIHSWRWPIPTPELVITLKLPNDVNLLLRHLSQAYCSAFPNSSDLMNHNHNLNVNLPAITCMVWNTQGTGNREFQAVIRELLRVYKPIVYALVETHMGGEHATKLANITGYSGLVRVDPHGFSGGIWVYWKPDFVTVTTISTNDQYINLEIKRQGEVPWYFSAIYASPDPSRRQELWRELQDFARTHNKPWLLAGDFNETRYLWERNSSCSDTTRRSANFNHWIEDNQLIELEFSGLAHTWSRGLSTNTRRSARLDRALCSSEWSILFDKAHVKHLPAL
ncbi:putative RNA-directed DNA polymerase from transposon X-element [Bienertia sinuspersici]